VGSRKRAEAREAPRPIFIEMRTSRAWSMLPAGRSRSAGRRRVPEPAMQVLVVSASKQIWLTM
jgi:hypothetical protein